MKLPLRYKKMAVAHVRELKADDETPWDRRNRATGEMYCIHGVNVGTWDGPDLMCGACESGVTLYEFALYCAWDTWRSDRRRAHQRISDHVFELFKGESGEQITDLFEKHEWFGLLDGLMNLAPELTGRRT